MIPWQLLDSTPIPGSDDELRLYKRDKEFSIMVNGSELMNSRMHGSEDALAELACKAIADRPSPRVLIGGLGMGYTVTAALRRLGDDGRVVVAELLPALVKWNRGPLAELAGHPLRDHRVTVQETDLARVLQAERGAYDAILIDVDNGPEAVIRKENLWLYARAGLSAAFRALRPASVLAVWSAGPDPAFTKRLHQAGFKTDEVRVRARGNAGGWHTIWLALRVS